MLSRNSLAIVSGGLLGCMFVVAADELAHGASVGEIHLITPVSLATGTVGSTITQALAGIGYFDSTTTEAVYRAPSDSSPLPYDGVTVPSIVPLRSPRPDS
jgi:hypothetical protein